MRFTLLIILFFGVFNSYSQVLNKNQALKFQQELAPDKRIAIFETQFRNDSVFIVTDQVAAAYTLSSYKNVVLSFLPHHKLGSDTLGVVNVPLAHVRSKPGHSQELATQALMGTPVRILDKTNAWYRVQTPDKYIGYLPSSSLVIGNSFFEGNNSLLMYTKPFGFAFTNSKKNAPHVSSLTYGNLIRLKDNKGPRGSTRKYLKIELPDGRQGYVKKSEVTPLHELNFNASWPSGDRLEQDAVKMLGVPYLWGGTSWKGVDCSGFTRTVYASNGVYLPRDASQQALLGETIEYDKSFEQLEKGDLIFFGRIENQQPKVTHVAMSLGKAQFIHSSGYVKIASLDPTDSNFDEYNASRVLFVKRLNEKTDGIKFLNSQTLY